MITSPPKMSETRTSEPSGVDYGVDNALARDGSPAIVTM